MIECTGIHESNPCGYLAGLGLLVLANRYDDQAKLSWSDEGCAILHTEMTIDRLADWLAQDNPTPLPDTSVKLRSIDVDQWLNLDLPTWLGRPDGWSRTGVAPDTTRWMLTSKKDRSGGWLARAKKCHAFMGDAANWREAMTGWRYENDVSPLGLDPIIRQQSALQAEPASSTGQIATASAVWLAIWGLTLLPVMPGRTAGWWSVREIRYATWTEPFGLALVKSLARARPSKDLTVYGVTRHWVVDVVETENMGEFFLSFASSG